MVAKMYAFFTKKRQKSPVSGLSGEELQALVKLTVQNNAMLKQILSKHYQLEQAFNIHPTGDINLDAWFDIHPDRSNLIRESVENKFLSHEIWDKHFPKLLNPFQDGQ